MKILKTSLLVLLSTNVVSAFVTKPSQRTFVQTNFQSEANVFSRYQNQLFSEVPGMGESPTAETVKDEPKEKFTAYVVNLSYGMFYYMEIKVYYFIHRRKTMSFPTFHFLGERGRAILDSWYILPMLESR